MGRKEPTRQLKMLDDVTSVGDDADDIADVDDGLPWCLSLPEAVEYSAEEELLVR